MRSMIESSTRAGHGAVVDSRLILLMSQERHTFRKFSGNRSRDRKFAGSFGPNCIQFGSRGNQTGAMFDAYWNDAVRAIDAHLAMSFYTQPHLAVDVFGVVTCSESVIV